MGLKAIISFFSQRLWILLLLCVVALLGFWFWSYQGPARRWFNYYASCMIYEVFWSLAVFFFWPRRKNAAKIAVIVFLVTCGLEVLQLYKPVFLREIRATFLGAATIGTCFVWWQFPHYVLGALIGFLLMWLLGQSSDT